MRVVCVRVMCVRVMCVRVMCVRVMCVRVMCVRVMCVRVMCVRVMCVCDVCACDVCACDVCAENPVWVQERVHRGDGAGVADEAGGARAGEADAVPGLRLRRARRLRHRLPPPRRQHLRPGPRAPPTPTPPHRVRLHPDLRRPRDHSRVPQRPKHQPQ